MPDVAFGPPPLTDEQLAAHFPIDRKDPIKPGAFEFGLVLGGTVSAGAYTAGVLDFLIEALDAWAAAKAAGTPNTPKHDAILSVIAGTSGGAVNGAMLMRVLGRNDRRGPDPANPLYTTWTDGLGFAELLSLDGETSPPAALLNASALERKAQRIIDLDGGSAPAARGVYLANPLRLVAMVSNITGVPYTIPMGGESNLSHSLSAHMDHVRFALAVPGGVPASPTTRDDELAISGNDAAKTNWRALSAAALASCAFPLALPARPVDRALSIAGYRIVTMAGVDGAASTVAQLRPDWATLAFGEQPEDVSHFVNVDGGAFNNEPLDMARTALSGMAGRNSRVGNRADRAVVLIDPFSDPGGITAEDRQVRGPLQMAGPVVGALVSQGRFKPLDIVLAADEKVYSRFLVAPVGPQLDTPESATVGSAAIASGGLGGFLGFLDRRFLDYDFRLGRRNAQRFLQKHFMFPLDNPIVQQGYAGIDTAPYLDDGHLPMIPLVGSARPEVPKPAPIPQLPGLPPGFEAALQRRLDHLFAKLIVEGSGASWIARQYLKIGWSLGGRSKVIEFAREQLINALRKQRLMPGG